MTQAWRTFRRAPARIITSVLALALAVGAMGVFAIPAVSTSSLRDAAERDGIGNVFLITEDTGDLDVASLTSVDGVVRAESQVLTWPIIQSTGDDMTLLGVDVDDQQMDIVNVDAGRLPTAIGEIVVDGDVAPIGTEFVVRDGSGVSVDLTVVGIGGTSFCEGDGLDFTDIETARAVSGIEGANRVVVRAESGTSESELGDLATALRDSLAADGVALAELPFTIEDGTHPIEQDIDQVSMLIGFLGIVAGVVGLVLLASTTNTLVTERTREVAVMRALGGTPRALRRRLRRIALSIAAAGVVIGLPLGIAISNVIARMVLEEFVGLTPGLAVSIPVLAASAAFVMIGARIVSARAARRVVGLPLAAALRDRDGVPFGQRWSERVVARFRGGALLDRVAVRNGVQRRGRSFAIAAQIGAAVSALLIVASMATTINDFNAAELEPWRWESQTYVVGPGLDIAADAADGDARSETGITVEGETAEWQIDVYGFAPETAMVDRSVDAGRWFTPGADSSASGRSEAVVSRGFAQRTDVEVGDVIEVELWSGDVEYEVVGLHGNRGREVYLDRSELATDLGVPGAANRLWSLDQQPATQLAGQTGVDLYDDLDEDDSGRQAILTIFGAIGVVVVSVAGLAVASGLVVNVYERRRELAALQAIGGRRRHVLRMVWVELLGMAVVGIGIGVVGGYLGARAITQSFESSNAVEIGFTFASGALPVVIAVVVAGTVLLGVTTVRRVTRRPVAETLRAAA